MVLFGSSKSACPEPKFPQRRTAPSGMRPSFYAQTAIRRRPAICSRLRFPPTMLLLQWSKPCGQKVQKAKSTEKNGCGSPKVEANDYWKHHDEKHDQTHVEGSGKSPMKPNSRFALSASHSIEPRQPESWQRLRFAHRAISNQVGLGLATVSKGSKAEVPKLPADGPLRAGDRSFSGPEDTQQVKVAGSATWIRRANLLACRATPPIPRPALSAAYSCDVPMDIRSRSKGCIPDPGK